MRSFFVLELLCISILAVAQQSETGVIKGVVKTSDGEPAGSVSVIIKGIHVGTVTSENGSFEFRRIKPGNYILVFSLSGYFAKDSSVSVKENEQIFLHVQLEQTFAELQKVIVTAGANTKYLETNLSSSLPLTIPLNEIPQNITVVNNQLLAAQGSLTTTEAIRNVSGIVKLYGDLNDYSYIIRGTDATYNVFRNGLVGYWWNQQEDAAMIEKIEFIKGPAGFMTSIAQPGGFVNNITKQPTKERIASINAGFGSYILMRLTADFGGLLNKKAKFSYRFNVGAHQQQRVSHLIKAFRYFVCGSIRYEPGKKTSITAEYNNMRGKTMGNNYLLPSINKKMFSLPWNFVVSDAKTDRLTADDKYYRILLRHNFNDNWKLNAQVAYVHGIYRGNLLWADDATPVINDTLNRIAGVYDFYNYSGVAQAFIDGKFYTNRKTEHKILLGIDGCNAGWKDSYRDTRGQQNLGLYLPNPDYYVDPDTWKNIVVGPPTRVNNGYAALYMQDHIKIAGKLIVTIAGRFTHSFSNTDAPDVADYDSHKIKNKITPRSGLTWLFSNDISVYALYDQSFWPQFARSYDHKRFQPLTGYNLETGMKGYFFNKKLGFNFSIYHIVKNNTITEDPLHNGFQIQTGQVTSNGIDFDMTGNITPRLVVNVNYGYTDAKITKDSDPSIVGLKNFGSPDHYGNLWLKYKLQKGKWKGVSFAAGYQYMGRRSAVWFYNSDPATRFLPVYNLLDASINYSNEKFNINFNVYNITGTRYATSGYFNPGINEWRYTPGEPINFRLSIGINLVRER